MGLRVQQKPLKVRCPPAACCDLAKAQKEAKQQVIYRFVTHARNVTGVEYHIHYPEDITFAELHREDQGAGVQK